MASKQFYSNYYIIITYFAVVVPARARGVACTRTRTPSIQRVVLSHNGDNELINYNQLVYCVIN